MALVAGPPSPASPADPMPVYLADSVIAFVGDIQVSQGIYRDVRGRVQHGARGRPAVPAIARRTGARHGK